MLVFDDLDGGERRSRCHRVFLVGVVADGEVTANIKFWPTQRRGDRQNPATQRFADHQHVRHDIVMITGEHAARFAKARRNFIEDQECAGLIAGASNLLPKTFRWDIGNGAVWLGHDSGDISFLLQREADEAGDHVTDLLIARCFA